MTGIKKRTMQEFCDFFNIYLCKNAEGTVQIFTAKPAVCNGNFTGCRFYSSTRIIDFISDIENLKEMEKIEPCHTQEKNMTVKEIVKEYLEKNGYDGLCGENCGCGLDDFMPCGMFANDSTVIGCNPAYKHKCNSDCTNCGDDELCELVENYSTEKKEK